MHPAVVGAVCGIACAAGFALIVGAVILRSACSIYLSIRGAVTDDSAPAIPDFGRALFIVAVIAGAGALLALVVAFATNFCAAAMRFNPTQIQTLRMIITTPIGFLVGAGILAKMLPTSFSKACLITLIQYAILLVIALVMGAVVVGVTAATGGIGRWF